MRMLIKTFLAIIPLVLSLQSYAHGITDPQHGGIVKVIGDVSLELVRGSDHVRVYILDDVTVDTSGMSGKLKVESSAGKSQYPLTPIEDGGLEADGARVPSDSTVLAIIVKADGYSKIAAKFQIK